MFKNCIFLTGHYIAASIGQQAYKDGAIGEKLHSQHYNRGGFSLLFTYIALNDHVPLSTLITEFAYEG